MHIYFTFNDFFLKHNMYICAFPLLQYNTYDSRYSMYHMCVSRQIYVSYICNFYWSKYVKIKLKNVF